MSGYWATWLHDVLGVQILTQIVVWMSEYWSRCPDVCTGVQILAQCHQDFCKKHIYICCHLWPICSRTMCNNELGGIMWKSNFVVCSYIYKWVSGWIVGEHVGWVLFCECSWTVWWCKPLSNVWQEPVTIRLMLVSHLGFGDVSLHPLFILKPNSAENLEMKNRRHIA